MQAELSKQKKLAEGLGAEAKRLKQAASKAEGDARAAAKSEFEGVVSQLSGQNEALEAQVKAKSADLQRHLDEHQHKLQKAETDASSTIERDGSPDAGKGSPESSEGEQGAHRSAELEKENSLLRKQLLQLEESLAEGRYVMPLKYYVKSPFLLMPSLQEQCLSYDPQGFLAKPVRRQADIAVLTATA